MKGNTDSGKIDEQKLNDFMQKASGDISSTVSAVLVIIGNRLGLYKSMADNGPALGAQAGEKRIKEIVYAAGFTKFKRATQTPFNIVFEARP
jgi:hypothetical protein